MVFGLLLACMLVSLGNLPLSAIHLRGISPFRCWGKHRRSSLTGKSAEKSYERGIFAD